MSNEDTATPWRPWYALGQWSSALVLLVVLLAGFFMGQFPPPMGQLAFCAFGVFTGFAFARMAHPIHSPLTRLGRVALGFVAASQIFYQLLVWVEPWRVHPSVLGWRLWWGTVVAAIGLGWLQVLWRAGARWEWKSGRATLGFTAILGVLFLGLSFRENPAASLPAWWGWMTAAMLLGAITGSGVLICRWWRKRERNERPLPRWMRPALSVLGLGALCAGSFYLGRVTQPPPSPFDLMPSALAALSEDQLADQMDQDLAALRTLAEGMDELRARESVLHTQIRETWQREQRTMYTPTENREIRRLFTEYLSHRASLIRMAALYSGYKPVADEVLRARAYLLGYTAAAVALESGRGFVARYRDNERAQAKLNEGEPGWLKEGMFDEVYHSVTSMEHLQMFRVHGRLFASEFGRWQRGQVWAARDLQWLAARIHRGQVAVDSIELHPVRAWFSRVGRRLQRDAYNPVYEAQELVATFMGDTRIVRREAFIPVDLVRETLATYQLEPGDIILERRNWYLSNAFLPGFWPHTALYIGTPDQLKTLGLDADQLGAHWHEYTMLDHGNPRVVIEAVSDGVVFASAEHSMNADYVAVLRPRLTQAQKAEAIRRAFAHHGKPYDFNFDFGTADKLVCSELVYHAYEGLLDFEMEEVVGKKVITPLGIMNKFVAQRGTPAAQLDFVFFLDTAPGAKRARLASEAACCDSATRPKVFNE